MQYSEKPCPVCGGVGRFRTYCSNACKQRAYRKRRDNEKSMLTQIVTQFLESDLDQREYKLVCSLLNTIPGKKYTHAVDQALRIIINRYHMEIASSKRIAKAKQHAITAT